jgi:prepilin-type N-terminal cleavage/methylation domain-containing protein
MGRMDESGGRELGAPSTGAAAAFDSESGFTLVEVSTSLVVLAIVLAAAWTLLTVSTNNLNGIDYGGQASELNRAALASFERDLGHAILPSSGGSPVLQADGSTCAFLCDVDGDKIPELVRWGIATVDDGVTTTSSLIREVTESTVDTVTPDTLADFATSQDITSVAVLTYLDINYPSTIGDHRIPQMFAYAPNGTAAPNLSCPAAAVSVITIRLRNGLPDSKSNIVDRQAAFRIIAFTINDDHWSS